jgi:hypothetical protein
MPRFISSIAGKLLTVLEGKGQQIFRRSFIKIFSLQHELLLKNVNFSKFMRVNISVGLGSNVTTNVKIICQCDQLRLQSPMTSCYHRSRTVPVETQTPSFEHVHIPGTCSSNMGTAKKFVTLPSPPARTPSSRFSRLPFFDSIFPKISSRYAYRARED